MQSLASMIFGLRRQRQLAPPPHRGDALPLDEDHRIREWCPPCTVDELAGKDRRYRSAVLSPHTHTSRRQL